jgi:hypothetical protein
LRRVTLFGRARTERAVARIVAVHDLKIILDGNPYSGGGRTPIGERVSLRVRPKGRSEFDSEAKVRVHSSFAFENRDTYVLYDPGKPEHCDIDYDRLEKEFGLTKLTCFPIPADGVSALRWGPHAPSTLEPQSSTPVSAARAEDAEPAPALQDAPSGESDPLVSGLTQLHELHRAGGLSDEEFAVAKARLLDKQQS